MNNCCVVCGGNDHELGMANFAPKPVSICADCVIAALEMMIDNLGANEDVDPSGLSVSEIYGDILECDPRSLTLSELLRRLMDRKQGKVRASRKS